VKEGDDIPESLRSWPYKGSLRKKTQSRALREAAPARVRRGQRRPRNGDDEQKAAGGQRPRSAVAPNQVSETTICVSERNLPLGTAWKLWSGPSSPQTLFGSRWVQTRCISNFLPFKQALDTFSLRLSPHPPLTLLLDTVPCGCNGFPTLASRPSRTRTTTNAVDNYFCTLAPDRYRCLSSL